MPSVALPPDLLAFLRSGAPLSYDATRCECGRVTLVGADQLTAATIPVQTEDTPTTNPTQTATSKVTTPAPP